MKIFAVNVFLAGLTAVNAHPADLNLKRDVYTNYPYTGPAIPVGDWVDPTVNGNGKGFLRLTEDPAVKPKSKNPTNNINVISVSYVPNGVNVHFQTPFGLGVAPSIEYGVDNDYFPHTASGKTTTYDRTPPCSLAPVTQCSQFYHDIQVTGLDSNKKYYYRIKAANGTTQSQVLHFKTSRAAGDKNSFTMAVLNDMGYTNAQGTYKHLSQSIDNDNVAFAWHGGDISYADDWYSGILPCASDWPVCFNGSSSALPGGKLTNFYKDTPLPKGEVPNQGGPLGGDMSVLYESNWDLWQQWMNKITQKIPYMVIPGNHEASCAEFDGPGNVLTSYLNQNKPNTTTNSSALTYYSCPPSQRNFTAYQFRFRMPGAESGGVGNFWYSFDYGLAHFVSINSETDFAYSPEWPFIRDNAGAPGLPAEQKTFPTDSGPFGNIDNNNYKDNTAYEQYQWLAKDLAAVDRTKTPWVIVMGHRPMYSSQVSSYQGDVRDAFQALLLKYDVDAYLSGHIHWYERMYPLTATGAIDKASITNSKGTEYTTNPGVSLTHIINGMAGNIESHSVLGTSPQLNITAVLDQTHYGFNKITFTQNTAKFTFIKGVDGSVGDEVVLKKKGTN